MVTYYACRSKASIAIYTLYMATIINKPLAKFCLQCQNLLIRPWIGLGDIDQSVPVPQLGTLTSRNECQICPWL